MEAFLINIIIAGRKWRAARAFIALLNFLYKVSTFLGWDMLPLTVDKVMEPLNSLEKEEVLRKDFLEPLKILLESHKIMYMTGLQRFIVLKKCSDYARRRVAVKEEIKRNPDILKTRIEGPIVIVGLPRTGTTMLQRLLACDPQLISPMTWEMMEPVPAGRPDNWKDCHRYKKACKEMATDGAVSVCAGMESWKCIHDTGASLPEQCFLITHNYFYKLREITFSGADQLMNFVLNAPREHLENMYDFYRKFLQCIFYKNLDEGKRILLKSPSHLIYLEDYRKAMKNAKFIFTYRNARDMGASLCSLMATVSRVQHGYPVDNHYIRKVCLEYFAKASSRGIGTFKDMPKDSLVCLGYSELVKDPLAAVKKIYSQFRMDLPPEVLAKMQCHMTENEKNKYGKHNYGTIGDYGITEDDIRDAMPEYFEYFKNSSELM